MPSTLAEGPVQPQERVAVLDVLRGFTLWGIIQVNWLGFEGSIGRLLKFFISGSFFASFALLFGLGFAIQLMRAEARQRPFVLRYLYRSFLLFVIGAAHAVFLWSGDIVARYAFISMSLPLFRRWPPRLILTAAALMLTFSTYGGKVPDVGIADLFHRSDSVLVSQQQQARLAVIRENNRIQRMAHDGDTTYWAGVRARADRANLPRLLLGLTTLQGIKRNADYIALFLLGLWLGRRRVVEYVERNTRLICTAGAVGLVLGVSGNAWSAYQAFDLPTVLQGWRLESIGDIGMGLFYLASVAMLFTHVPRIRRWLSPLANVGRMSLTNYLMQTVLMTSLLYPRALGLRDKLGSPLAMLGVVNAVFLLQVAYSSLWFRYFRFGPVEWLWRSATWLRWQPIRQPRAPNQPHAMTRTKIVQPD